ncbi:MAG: DJ-1/PfpI family protein [Anaerolineae bacterium]|nr:DJ-1/PfpI family protein [Anaerolineae bacterium]
MKGRKNYDKLLSIMMTVVTKLSKMSNFRHGQTVMLLADGFDETPTISVLIALREAGLRTKLVGLRSKPTAGAHGIMLIPDLSLSQLLEMKSAICALILPGGGGHLERLRQDPRVNFILQSSADSDVAFVTIDQGAANLLEEYIRHPTRCLALYTGESRIDELGYQIVNWLLETERE